MANPSWNAWAPGFVGILPPKLPLSSGEDPIDMRISFEPEAGTGIFTNPVTKEGKLIPIPRWTMRDFQWTKLIEFYETQLYGGVVPFDWTDPWLTVGTKTFQFAKGGKPRISAVIGSGMARGVLPGEPALQRLVAVSCVLLELPWFP